MAAQALAARFAVGGVGGAPAAARARELARRGRARPRGRGPARARVALDPGRPPRAASRPRRSLLAAAGQQRPRVRRRAAARARGAAARAGAVAGDCAAEAANDGGLSLGDVCAAGGGVCGTGFGRPAACFWLTAAQHLAARWRGEPSPPTRPARRRRAAAGAAPCFCATCFAPRPARAARATAASAARAACRRRGGRATARSSTTASARATSRCTRCSRRRPRRRGSRTSAGLVRARGGVRGRARRAERRPAAVHRLLGAARAGAAVAVTLGVIVLVPAAHGMRLTTGVLASRLCRRRRARPPRGTPAVSGTARRAMAASTWRGPSPPREERRDDHGACCLGAFLYCGAEVRTKSPRRSRSRWAGTGAVNALE